MSVQLENEREARWFFILGMQGKESSQQKIPISTRLLFH